MAEFCPFKDCRHYRLGYAQLTSVCQKCKRVIHCSCGCRLNSEGKCPSCRPNHVPSNHMISLGKLKVPLIDLQSVIVKNCCVEITYIGRDRDTGRLTEFKFVDESMGGCDWTTLSHKEQVSYIKQCIVQAMKHEVDECFFISGLGPDPHL